MSTEAQAAAYIRKILKSCQKKIRKAAEDYGQDYNYLESLCEQANLRLEEIIEDMRAE